MINTGHMAKLSRMLGNIWANYPNVKIIANCDLLTGACSLYVQNKSHKLFRTFPHLAACLVCLNFLNNAHFSALALKSCKKRKLVKRKKNLFFLWLEKGKKWHEIEGQTLGELWAEYEQEITPQEVAQETPPRDETEAGKGNTLEE